MSNTRNTTARVAMVFSAAALSVASASCFLPKAFADGPTDKIEVTPDVDIYGGPFAYTGEQICPSRLLVTADVEGEDVILENGVDYNYNCGENIEIGADSGVINLSAVEGSLYTFDSFSVNFSIWEHLQEISYEATYLEKTYGDDDFTNPLTETEVHGEISYSSSDEDVATVDDDGEVTIWMPGDTVITATAAAADGYGEGIATYSLNVNKKPVAIVSAVAEDKTYDGTDAAEISDIELDDDDLSEGSDFEAVGKFADANVGEDKNVAVTLQLSNDSARYYDVSNASYDTTATISPFEIDDGMATLSSDSFTYSGEENKPSVRLLTSLDGISDTYLTENADFSVSYPEDTTSAGTKTLTVNSMGNFTGSFEMEYDVDTYYLLASNVSLEYTTVYYDGTAKEPVVTVKIGEHTVDPSEYTVEYDDNVNVGTATVTVSANDGANISSYAVKEFDITDKNILEISGIENQSVTYTGNPVELAGNLTVSENTDGITANDVVATYYDEDGAEIERPIDAGLYTVVYSHESANYKGSLSVEFEIKKAESPVPAEMTAGLVADTGSQLNEIEGDRTDGFYWVDDTATVMSGENTYPATYTYNDDDYNYTTIDLNVPVRGVALVDVYVDVDSLGGDADYPDEAHEGDIVEITFKPEASYEIKTVMYNGEDVTGSVKDNKLTITAGTKNIEVLVSFRKVYTVLEGSGADFVVGDGEILSFRIDADHELFANGGKVYVDGVLVDEEYYTHTVGSTIITFTEEFIKSLGDGAHTMAVVFSDGGVARAEFTVENSGAEAKTPEERIEEKKAASAAVSAKISDNVKVPNTGFSTGESAGVKVFGSAIAAMVLAGFAVLSKKKLAKK